MKIETKYKIGDEVWIVSNSKATKSRVCRIDIRVFEDQIVTFYMSEKMGEHQYYETSYEEHTFSTKEELIASL